MHVTVKRFKDDEVKTWATYVRHEDVLTATTTTPPPTPLWFPTQNLDIKKARNTLIRELKNALQHLDTPSDGGSYRKP
jgi:hypothetical protein